MSPSVLSRLHAALWKLNTTVCHLLCTGGPGVDEDADDFLVTLNEPEAKPAADAVGATVKS